jgi:hypothetical protein
MYHFFNDLQYLFDLVRLGLAIFPRLNIDSRVIFPGCSEYGVACALLPGLSKNAPTT